jgi:predicted metallopeptidase
MIFQKKTRRCAYLQYFFYIFLTLDEPLKCFKIENLKQINDANDYLITNSVIKLLNDIFAIPQHSSNIFYLNDFQIIIDIIIRKLSNLSCEDQVVNKFLHFPTF